MVASHSHLIRTPDDRGQAVADFFRLEDGRAVEHWDVSREIPETSANANSVL